MQKSHICLGCGFRYIGKPGLNRLFSTSHRVSPSSCSLNVLITGFPSETITDYEVESCCRYFTGPNELTVTFQVNW